MGRPRDQAAAGVPDARQVDDGFISNLATVDQVGARLTRKLEKNPGQTPSRLWPLGSGQDFFSELPYSSPTDFFSFSDVRALFKKVTTRLLATYSLTPG